MSLVETDWLFNNLKKVKIIDCSWHMPQTKRNGFEEYKKSHIPGAIFFDLDENSKKNINLPHMLTNKQDWEKIVSRMGINLNDEIITYDNSFIAIVKLYLLRLLNFLKNIIKTFLPKSIILLIMNIKYNKRITRK